MSTRLVLAALVALTACAAEPVDRFGAPVTHRPTAPVCGAGAFSAAPRPPPSPPAGAVPCSAAGRCADARDRCVALGASGTDASYCVRDACQGDADCGAGRLCACPGEGAELIRVCIPANCRLDRDCAGGFCSPSEGSGCGGFTAGWYCHTSDDECHNDRDCPGSAGGTGHCYYATDRARWVCSPTHCG